MGQVTDFFGWAVQGRLGKFCCVEPGPGSERAGKVRCGRIGEAGRVTDRTVEEWQARRCMEQLCKERFGVAGMDGSGEAGCGAAGRVKFWQAWRGKEIPGQSWYETVSLGKAGEVGCAMLCSVVVRMGLSYL